MDVASTLRKEREMVTRELNLPETKEQLRQRLLAAADVTGECVSVGEVDAAIELYFDNLHTFREPSPGIQLTLARCYVRRGSFTVWLLAGLLLASVAAAALMIWGAW